MTPIPYLQIANLIGALLVFVLDWPCWPALCVIRTPWRFVAIVTAALPAWLLYQATNVGLYHLISAVLYMKAHQQKEVSWRCDGKKVQMTLAVPDRHLRYETK